MKRYRLQTCFFGAQGLRVARDAYLSSLAGAEPSVKRIPKLGSYPEHAKLRARFKDSGRKAGGWGRGLPFVRHIRSCAIAKTLEKGKDAAVDKVISQFDSYASSLNKTLMEAHRYYVRKEYEKDEFRKGGLLHGRLTKSFKTLDAELAALSHVVGPWARRLGPVSEDLNEGGKLATQAVAVARNIGLGVLASSPDVAAVKVSLEAIEKVRDALKERQTSAPTEPHPRVVMPRLEQFIEAATKLSERLASGTKLEPVEIYPTTSALASLIEANHRAHTHMLRRAAGAGPMRMLKPPIHRLASPRSTAMPAPKTTAVPAPSK